MNLKNLITTMLIMLITAFATYKGTLSSALITSKATANALVPAIVEGIKKETTAIHNKTSNSVSVKKLKPRNNKGLAINFKNNLPTDQEITTKPNTVPQYKEGDTIQGLILLERRSLTRRQKRRLKID